jgi:glycosyltransferase involved in cell wall biosynthesis
VRITFVVPVLNMSGGMRIIAIYAKRLQERGHLVTVVSPINSSPTLKERIKAIIRQRKWLKSDPRPDSFFQFMGVPVTFTNQADAVTQNDVPDADVLISCFWVAAEWASKFPMSKGRQFHFIQGYETAPGMDTSRLDAAWRLPMKKIVISNWLKKIAETKFGDHKCAVVQNSVDFKFFNSPPRHKQDVFSVGFLYNPAWCKAVDIAIQACKNAQMKIPDLKIYVLGVYKPKPGIIPADWQCFWNPPQEKIPWLYSHCDIWLWTSRQEGFGLPIIEAMACGTPVIGTRAGAAPQLLADGRGIFIDFDNPQIIADELIKVHMMPKSEWKTMSEKIYNYVRSYTWEDAVNLFEKAISEE